jgi:hypothetical protein
LTDLIAGIGADGKILCPFHADQRPSMHVYDTHAHCFSCGAHVDAVDFLMMVDGLTRNRALAVLENRDGALVVRKPPTATSDPERSLRAAWAIWNASKTIAGTLAMRYLADIRAIDVGMLPTDDAALRFHPQCPFGVGRLEPSLIALYRDVATDEPAGIHRIALPPQVFAGAKVERMTLGSWPRPRAIKLWPANGQLFLGEGIETVLAAATVLGKRPAWAAGSANNLGKFPVLPGIALTLLVDHDVNGQGEKYAAECARRWYAAGGKVRRTMPPQPGTDFNDLIFAQRRISQ